MEKDREKKSVHIPEEGDHTIVFPEETWRNETRAKGELAFGDADPRSFIGV